MFISAAIRGDLTKSASQHERRDPLKEDPLRRYGDAISRQGSGEVSERPRVHSPHMFEGVLISLFPIVLKYSVIGVKLRYYNYCIVLVLDRRTPRAPHPARNETILYWYEVFRFKYVRQQGSCLGSQR